MQALLLVAHGSRRPQSNDEVRELALSLANQSRHFSMVLPAFLELAEPSIPDGIQHCIDAGANEIVVLPYFLSAGRHVTKDIPNEVAIKQRQYPELNIHIAPYLGLAEKLPQILLEQVELNT